MQTKKTPTILNNIEPKDFKGMLRGVEKEGLRMQTDGYLAQTPHPKKLGSTLTHPHITTDYSESLLELITQPKNSIDEMLTELTELHALVYNNLENDEILWPLSMPCMLSNKDSDIPLANYGTSNIGKLKTLYRNGLGLRYGRRMQTIAGLHYNLSFPDVLFEKLRANKASEQTLAQVKNQQYLGLIRNFKRLSVIVLYLLGASPNVCSCFLIGRKHHLSKGEHSLFLPNATSLRMGKLGYQNSAQDDLGIKYNDLQDYIDSLRQAISLPHAEFTAFGIDDENDNPIQINDHILQIENEFYSNIRPKQVANSGETPTHALEERGIEYIELRAVDIDPFSPVGISVESASFLEIMATYCLLLDSPELNDNEEQTLASNQDNVVNNGRDKNTKISVFGEDVNFHDWMLATLDDMTQVAEYLDKMNADNTIYQQALLQMKKRVQNPELTPSAQLLKNTIAHNSMWKYGKTLAQKYAEQFTDSQFLDTFLPPSKQAEYDKMASNSVNEQLKKEASDTMTFKEFVQEYR